MYLLVTTSSLALALLNGVVDCRMVNRTNTVPPGICNHLGPRLFLKVYVVYIFLFLIEICMKKEMVDIRVVVVVVVVVVVSIEMH